MRRTLQPPDPFRFGWREVHQLGPDGTKQWMRVPLTPEDLLHPQKGDQIVENTQQERDRGCVAAVLRYRLSSNPRALVLSDCQVNWGIPGLGNHSPDVSVFDNVNEAKHRNWGTFRVAEEGARPVLAIEIVSPDAHDPRARDNDVVIKVREYYRAGLPLYVIVDQEREGRPRQVVGYRRGARKYLHMRLDTQGRLLLEPVRLLLGLQDERAAFWDADSGEEIGDLTAMAQARDAEAQARRAAEAALAEAQAHLRALEAQLRRNGSQS